MVQARTFMTPHCTLPLNYCVYTPLPKQASILCENQTLKMQFL